VNFSKSDLSKLTLALTFFLGLLMILLGINRGFDTSDEGLYSLLLNPHQANESGVYNYDLIFKLLYELSGIEFGIVGSRVIRLISYLIGGFALALFWKNIHADKKIDLNVWLVSVLGVFSGYAFLPPSLSYNSISVVIVCLWLYLITKETPSFWVNIGIGFLLALLFYVKITTCGLLGLLTVLIISYRRSLSPFKIILLLLPFLFLESLFYLTLHEAGIFRVLEGYQMMVNREDYQWVLLVKHNLVGVFWILVASIPFFITARAGDKFRWYLLVVSILFELWVIQKTMITDEWSHGIYIVTCSIIAFLIGCRKDWNWKASKTLFFIILMILPFALHFGSNVYFLRLGIHYWVFGVLGIFFLIGHQPISQKINFVYSFCFLSLILIANGIWFGPFGQLHLLNNTEEWEYRKGKKILLSREMVSVLEDMKEKIRVVPNEEIISVYRNPGWMVLLDLTSPQNPGIWDQDQLNTYFPNFPDGFEYIIYFPYQELPGDAMSQFQVKKYSLPQGEVNLLWRK